MVIITLVGPKILTLKSKVSYFQQKFKKNVDRIASVEHTPKENISSPGRRNTTYTSNKILKNMDPAADDGHTLGEKISSRRRSPVF